jgi:hypothetical protein
VVEFEEYMWSERFPQGITVTEDSELARKFPQIFLPPPKKEKKTDIVKKEEPKKEKERPKVIFDTMSLIYCVFIKCVSVHD